MFSLHCDTYVHSSFLNPSQISGMGGSSYLPFANGAAPLNDEVSSAAMNLQQLSLGKESTVPSSVDNCAVVFPNYIQAFSADCSHLSFGTYKSGVHDASYRPLASNPSKIYLEDDSAVTDVSSAGCLETRHDSFSLVPVFTTYLFIVAIIYYFFFAEIQGTLVSNLDRCLILID